MVLLRRYGWILIGIGLLLAVYLLPPDTSLAETQRGGTLTACVPTARPPLVTGDPAKPGIEVELLGAIAGEMGLKLSLNTIPAMGQDFNPRSWNLTRAQCAVIAGGLADSIETRSYLSPGPSYGETGWVLISATGGTDLSGKTVGVLATLQGGDRIALSGYLRSVGAKASLARSVAQLSDGLAAGTYDAGVAEAMTARGIAVGPGWSTSSLPPPLETHALIFGLWKGDLTLKRAIEAAFVKVKAAGKLDEIVARYDA
jgi:polar amino acid transport system substrate-binding protein/cystine transport system substrate-binding protein/membrane-bound lytic murein transglycosylase F